MPEVQLERLEYGKRCISSREGVLPGADYQPLAWSPGFPEEFRVQCRPGIINSADDGVDVLVDTLSSFIIRPIYIKASWWIIASRLESRPEGGHSSRLYRRARYIAFKCPKTNPPISPSPIALYRALHDEPLRAIDNRTANGMLEPIFSPLEEPFSAKRGSAVLQFSRQALIYTMSGIPIHVAPETSVETFIQGCTYLWWLLPQSIRRYFCIGYRVSSSLCSKLNVSATQNPREDSAQFYPNHKSPWRKPKTTRAGKPYNAQLVEQAGRAYIMSYLPRDWESNDGLPPNPEPKQGTTSKIRWRGKIGAVPSFSEESFIDIFRQPGLLATAWAYFNFFERWLDDDPHWDKPPLDFTVRFVEVRVALLKLLMRRCREGRSIEKARRILFESLELFTAEIPLIMSGKSRLSGQLLGELLDALNEGLPEEVLSSARGGVLAHGAKISPEDFPKHVGRFLEAANRHFDTDLWIELSRWFLMNFHRFDQGARNHIAPYLSKNWESNLRDLLLEPGNQSSKNNAKKSTIKDIPTYPIDFLVEIIQKKDFHQKENAAALWTLLTQLDDSSISQKDHIEICLLKTLFIESKLHEIPTSAIPNSTFKVFDIIHLLKGGDHSPSKKALKEAWKNVSNHQRIILLYAWPEIPFDISLLLLTGFAKMRDSREVAQDIRIRKDRHLHPMTKRYLELLSRGPLDTSFDPDLWESSFKNTGLWGFFSEVPTNLRGSVPKFLEVFSDNEKKKVQLATKLIEKYPETGIIKKVQDPIFEKLDTELFKKNNRGRNYEVLVADLRSIGFSDLKQGRCIPVKERQTRDTSLWTHIESKNSTDPKLWTLYSTQKNKRILRIDTCLIELIKEIIRTEKSNKSIHN